MTSRWARVVIGAMLGAALVASAEAQQRVSVYTAHTANIVERLIRGEIEATRGEIAALEAEGEAGGQRMQRARARLESLESVF